MDSMRDYLELPEAAGAAGHGPVIALTATEVSSPIERAKPGRQSKYTPELGDLICDRIAEGRFLRDVCRDRDISVDEKTVRRWRHEPAQSVCRAIRAGDDDQPIVDRRADDRDRGR